MGRGKKWTCKRKIQTDNDSNKKKYKAQRIDDDPPLVHPFHYEKSSPKMESYYALQGLHAHRKAHDDDDEEEDEDKNDGLQHGFVRCKTDLEMEEERKRWVSTLALTLPTSFRIGLDLEQDLRDRMEKELNQFVGNEFDIIVSTVEGKGVNKGSTTTSNDHLQVRKMTPVQRIPFIPHAYQLSIDKRTIRRNPLMESFHTWLKVHSDAGFLSRLETVSMIPPVVLAPEPHHRVLDMCAAPGSKTAALLEMIGSTSTDGSQEPKGFVVANDKEYKRAFMMVHQLKRLNTPALFVTSTDARRWPLLIHKNNSTLEEQALEGMFDRVLCDVPCSGDGTARKNAGIWKRWSPDTGLSLHPLQLSIALNGAKLTKVGGYMCYSTCSMNPVENEAVVAELLRLADGSLELVDRRLQLPGILARSGWKTWKVLSEETIKSYPFKKQKTNANKEKSADASNHLMEAPHTVPIKIVEQIKDKITTTSQDLPGESKSHMFQSVKERWTPEPSSWDDDCLMKRAQQCGMIWYKTAVDVPEIHRKAIRVSCFPPSKEEAEKMSLQKCLRILPHDMDTGGFFVALLKKIAPLSKRAKKIADELDCTLEEENKNDDDSSATSSDDLDPIPNEETSEAKCLEDKISKSIGQGIGTEFFISCPSVITPPLVEFYGLDTFPWSQIHCKSNGDSKVLYFITTSISKNLIERGVQERVKVITSGLRAFERGHNDDVEVGYRLLQEGIHLVAPYMHKRKIVLTIADFQLCLNAGAIPIQSFSSEVADYIRSLSGGSFVAVLKDFENNKRKKMFVTLWKCRGDNINCLVNKQEVEGLISKLNAIREESNEK